MSTLVGLSFSIAILSLVSYLFYPESTFSLSKKLFRAAPKSKVKFYPEAWPDAVDDLASSIRAGLSLPQALVNLTRTGPEALRPNLSLAMSRYELTGDFVGALKILRNTLQDPIVDKFTSALQIAYEVGGTDLGLLLRNLSEVIREDNKVRGEISARQSWTINGARLAIAAPWLTVLILSTRQSAAAIYLSSQGIRLLLFCAILSFFAYFLMTRLGQLPVAERIAS